MLTMMEVEVEELCTSTVTRMPTTSPATGLERMALSLKMSPATLPVRERERQGAGAAVPPAARCPRGRTSGQLEGRAEHVQRADEEVQEAEHQGHLEKGDTDGLDPRPAPQLCARQERVLNAGRASPCPAVPPVPRSPPPPSALPTAPRGAEHLPRRVLWLGCSVPGRCGDLTWLLQLLQAQPGPLPGQRVQLVALHALHQPPRGAGAQEAMVRASHRAHGEGTGVGTRQPVQSWGEVAPMLWPRPCRVPGGDPARHVEAELSSAG